MKSNEPHSLFKFIHFVCCMIIQMSDDVATFQIIQSFCESIRSSDDSWDKSNIELIRPCIWSSVLFCRAMGGAQKPSFTNNSCPTKISTTAFFDRKSGIPTPCIQIDSFPSNNSRTFSSQLNHLALSGLLIFCFTFDISRNFIWGYSWRLTTRLLLAIKLWKLTWISILVSWTSILNRLVVWFRIITPWDPIF